MSEEEREGVQKVLRVTIMRFINVRNQMFSRSEETLQYFTIFEHSLFMLYSKVYFSMYNPEVHTPLQKQTFKTNLTMGAYFLASGTSFIHPSIYESAVVFVYANLRLPGI